MTVSRQLRRVKPWRVARRNVAEKRHASFCGPGARRVRGGGRHCCKRRPIFRRLTPLEPRGPRLRGPHVDITDFRGIHEHRYLPYAEEWPIARRYCGATAALSDGSDRTIWYLIEDGMGFVGIGDNVEFCVSGFDRWFVYNGHCRILR